MFLTAPITRSSHAQPTPYHTLASALLCIVAPCIAKAFDHTDIPIYSQYTTMAWRCHHCAHHNRGPSNMSSSHAAPCQNFSRRPRCNHKACAQCVLGIANPFPAEAEWKQLREARKREREGGRGALCFYVSVSLRFGRYDRKGLCDGCGVLCILMVDVFEAGVRLAPRNRLGASADIKKQ